MKIALLCSSLAAGRDGVGDYARRLAQACTDRGHTCLLVALNDRHLGANAVLRRAGHELRFPAALAWTRRAVLLRRLLRDFQPDWVSWQLVPYGFDPKGILPAPARALADATAEWRSHVMLHELWLGLARADRLRPRLVGALQRRRLLAFLERLRPLCADTTNGAYQLALAHAGWPAGILPLFGNIPVLPVPPAVARAELATVPGLAAAAEGRVLGVIFGTVHPQWQPEETLAWLRAAARAGRQRLALLSVGHAGASGARTLAALARRSGDIPVVVAGAQPPEQVSRLLHAADFGVATHPWELIEKSGTTASLLEHGLPVLVPRDDWRSRHGAAGPASDPLLRRISELPPAGFRDWLAQRRPAASRLPGVVDEFLARLADPAPPRALVA